MELFQWFINGKLFGYHKPKTFTEDNLPEYDLLNTANLDVSNPVLISFNSETGSWTAPGLGWTYIQALMKWNYSRWIYEGLPDELTKENIERLLFVWGKCVIFKYKEEYYVANFEAKTWNLHKEPLKIVAILDGPDKKQIRIPLTNGTDAVVIYENVGHWWGKAFAGPLLMGLPLLNNLVGLDYQISKNRLLLNSKLLVKPSMTIADQKKLTTAFQNPANITLPYDPSNMGEGSTKTAGNEIKNGIVEFPDHIPTLINTYQFREDQLKKFFGIRKNANSMKAERQISAEVSVDNVIPDRIADTALEYRKKGFERVKKIFGLNITVEIQDSEQEDSMFADKKDTFNKEDNKNET